MNRITYSTYRALPAIAISLMLLGSSSAFAQFEQPVDSDEEMSFSVNPVEKEPAEERWGKEPKAEIIVEEVKPKSWQEMNYDELKAEKARLDSELQRTDIRYSPREKKQMRNLLKRVESQMIQKTMQPQATVEEKPVVESKEPEQMSGEGKEVDAAAEKTPKTEEKKPELSSREKLQEKIRNRRFREGEEQNKEGLWK